MIYGDNEDTLPSDVEDTENQPNGKKSGKPTPTVDDKKVEEDPSEQPS